MATDLPVTRLCRPTQDWRFRATIIVYRLPDGRWCADGKFLDTETGAEAIERLRYAKEEDSELMAKLLGIAAQCWAHEQAHGTPISEDCRAVDKARRPWVRIVVV